MRKYGEGGKKGRIRTRDYSMHFVGEDRAAADESYSLYRRISPQLCGPWRPSRREARDGRRATPITEHINLDVQQHCLSST